MGEYRGLDDKRMSRISWAENETNEDVLRAVETRNELLDIMRSRQKRWIRHVLRHDCIVRTVLEG